MLDAGYTESAKGQEETYTVKKLGADTVAGYSCQNAIVTGSRGGTFEMWATGVPIGLGSHVQWDRKLDGQLAQAVMSIQAVKGVEIGPAFEVAAKYGTEAQVDAIIRGVPVAAGRVLIAGAADEPHQQARAATLEAMRAGVGRL